MYKAGKRPEQRRDREAVDALIQKYRSLVRSAARSEFFSLSRDPDVLQCGLIGLWEAAEQWDGASPFVPFARSCIRNNMRDYVRKLRRWGPTLAYDASLDTRAAADAPMLENLSLEDRIRAAWPPNSRERYILTALANGVSKTAVAVSLGLDTYQVTRIARRAWEALDAAPTERG